MKKFLAILISVFTLGLSCAAFGCSGSDDKTIVVGASSTPHAEILEQVKDDLKDQGYTLQIRIFDDYVTPNTALEQGELDANYFQHTPYLENFNAENGTHLVSVAKIHYEPFGVYGKNVTQDSFDTVKTGRTILIPSDGTNCTRALFVLQEQGYITLSEDATPADLLSDADIVDLNGNVVTLVEAAQLPVQLQNASDGTIAVINGNYALASNLSSSDALAYENAEGEAAQYYANIIAVKEGNEESEKIKALVAALLSQSVYDYIDQTYNGAVKPVFSLK